MTNTALNPAQRKALEIALASSSNSVYAGYNVNAGCRTRVNAQTIAALGRAGLLVVTTTTAGETVGTITLAGVAALGGAQ